MKKIKYLFIFVLLSLFSSATIVYSNENQSFITKNIETFTKLRMDFSKSPVFPKYVLPSKKEKEEKDKIKDMFKNGEYKKFLFLSEEWLEKYPVDPFIHRLRADYFAKHKDWESYYYHMSFLYGLLASLTSSGDGLSKETAIKVISINEEYFFLKHIRAKLIRQSVVDKIYDKMVCKLGDKEITFYFDYSIQKKHASELIDKILSKRKINNEKVIEKDNEKYSAKKVSKIEDDKNINNNTILEGKGLMGIEVNKDGLDKVIKILGEPSKVETPSKKSKAKNYYYEKLGVIFNIYDKEIGGKLNTIQIIKPYSEKTRNNISIGCSADEILNAYGDTKNIAVKESGHICNIFYPEIGIGFWLDTTSSDNLVNKIVVFRKR